MRYPWVNTVLLVLVPIALVSGYLGLTNGDNSKAWLVWVHAGTAYAIVAVSAWKVAAVRHSLVRHPLAGSDRPAFLMLGALTLFVLGSGILWAWAGPVQGLGTSLLTLHGLAAGAIVALFAWHVLAKRRVLRVRPARDRRAFLRLAVAGAAGVTAWQGGLVAMRLLDLRGASRRFTGSYETGSYSGEFPTVSWLTDNPDPISEPDWRLAVDGQVSKSTELTYREVVAMPATTHVATIDCTGGWYSTQEWSGVALGDLLAQAGADASAGSVTVTSVTGFNRRFSMAEARSALLATRVAGADLSDGHGWPLRLVVPGHRGFDWVKWVTQVTVNEHGDEWQAPLPLQ